MHISFDLLKIGESYSRVFLAEIWGYAAYQALARGVVTPKGVSKIILFVTSKKQESSTQYSDKLINEYLHWEGPNDHFAETRMVNARYNGEEIHLFFRTIHHSNFTYFGKIEVVDVELEINRPSRFIFHLNDYYSNIVNETISEYWSRRQLLTVFNLYLKLQSRNFSPDNPDIIYLSKLIGKSVNSIAIRLNNLAYIDPYNNQHGIVGLEEGADQIQSIWNEFAGSQEELVFESERILAEYQHKTIDDIHPEIVFDFKNLKGEVKERLVKTRVNQSVFRQMILKTYESRCAISGIDLPDLLVAGHIKPWAEDEHNRLNPENGVCLSNLYDRAYEKGLICIDTEYKLLISKRLKAETNKEFYQRFFGEFEYKPIRVPKTYQPKKEFLEYRLERFDKS
ncbi:HNH endonuclease [Spirosoma aerolatum]|uniref:HNH endonuclease n=1 Tax=Spirosoma aerolatum TaxID=1211326 RepID=UPI001FEC3460|nr:HNH endonuclease [Spirosoma aerolatum]